MSTGHLVHEVTSPQAFEGLRLTGPQIHGRQDASGGDHKSTTDAASQTLTRKARRDRLSGENAKLFGLEYFENSTSGRASSTSSGRNRALRFGHTIVCGDSHTATHGAFGALAYGIGTSEVEHVLATQTLYQKNQRTCAP